MPSYVVHPAMTDDNAALQARSAADGLLRANQTGRIVCAVVGNLLCWVPFRQLTRHGELAAGVLVADVVLLNCLTAANAALWPGDDWAAWWDGAGLCDAEAWLAAPLQTVYAAAVFAVMRRLARQLARRAPSDPRSDHLAQALVIFPVPLVQLAVTWFVLAQRYLVGALVGCSATYDSSWPKILLYTSPPALFALGAVPYAFLTWRRFRALAHTTAAALDHPVNGAAAARAARLRCRLYQMSLSILVPYVPLMLAFFAFSVRDTAGWRPYSYHRVHHTADPYPWGAVMFVPSWLVPPEVLNQPWLPILTTVPIVLFFGLTHDALAAYRRYARALRLHRLWPVLGGPPPRHRLPVESDDAAKLGSTLEDSHGSHHVLRHGLWDPSRREPNELSQDEPPDRPSVEPLTPAALADALERGQVPRRPRRPPLASDDAPSIPPRTSSRLAAFFGRRPRPAQNTKDAPHRPDDEDGGLGTPPWPLPPATAMLMKTSSGETRIRIQTRRSRNDDDDDDDDDTVGGPRRAATAVVARLGPAETTTASMPGVEEASLTDETATDSLGARLHRAGSQAAIRRLGLPRR